MKVWKNDLSNYIHTRQRIIATVGEIKDHTGDNVTVTFISVFFPYIQVELEKIEIRMKKRLLQGKNLAIGDVCNFTADIGEDKRNKRYDVQVKKEVEVYISGLKYHAFLVDEKAYIKSNIQHVSKYCLKEIETFVQIAQQQPLLDNYLHEVSCLENVRNEREAYVHGLFKQLKKQHKNLA